MKPILKLEEVVKTYGDHVAVDHVSFEVNKGAIFGLLGPNGAGKTSIIRIITTITRADSGQVYLNGEKLGSRHPNTIGYMPEERGLYRKMKVGDHLIYLARLKGLSKTDAKTAIDYWLEKFEITHWWNKKVEELSKGMQQKIQFIATVVHNPQILILDEPFSGLDPINTNLIKSEILRMKHAGTSIIFSTHRMEQVEEICEHIALIDQGKNVLEGQVANIKQQFKENLFEIHYEGQPVLPERAGLQVVSNEGGRLIIQLEDDRASNQILQELLKQSIYIHSFREILPSLNEIFIRQVETDKRS
ncbi:MAG: ATP-binding cassette domain-containing protein [Saprospiraceae bacterium]|nr:ATP-binding cassette domain-containing protein [Saprospiraceae bacterium]